MKLLLFVILFLYCIGGVQAKDTPFSLVCKNVSTDSVFRQLRYTLGYDVFYASKVFKSNTTHTVNFRNGTLDQFMRTLLPSKTLVYEIRNDAIIITGVKYDMTHRSKLRYLGYVFDNYGIPLAYASIADHKNDLLVQTDSVGFFSFELEYVEDRLFSFKHFTFDDKHDIELLADDTNYIQMKRMILELDEVVIRGNMQQERRNVVSAISSMKFDRHFINASSVGDYLAGKSSGVIAVTYTGEPGKDFADIWIRGISTFGEQQQPLILIDEFESDINIINMNDIDYISILKDGSATAEFGIRGANGVIMARTKRGRKGPIKLQFSQQFSISQSLQQPKYISALDYADLTNEARVVRGESSIYSDVEMKMIYYGLDKDFYPSVDWQAEVLNPYTKSSQSHLSVQGGDDDILYYFSTDYLKRDALFKTDLFDYKHHSIRANIDYHFTPTAKFSFNGFLHLKKQQKPGAMGDDDILFESVSKLNPLVIPIRYSNGQLPANSNDARSFSPHVLLNHTGKIITNDNTYVSQFIFSHDLSQICKGLSYNLRTNFYWYTQNIKQYLRTPELYKVAGRTTEGELLTERVTTSSSFFEQKEPQMNEHYDLVFSSKYTTKFSHNNILTCLLNGSLAQYKNEVNMVETTRGGVIPQRYLSLTSRLMYQYKQLFFAETDIAFMGADSYRYLGVTEPFYSIALGVNLTSIPSVRDFLSPIQHCKLRFSYGTVGNGINTILPRITEDIIIPSNNWGEDGIEPGYIDHFGTQWEKGKKFNIGSDIIFGNNIVNITTDYFYNIRTGISQTLSSVPEELGIIHPLSVSKGRMINYGIDGGIDVELWNNQKGKLSLKSSITWSKNVIKHAESDYLKFPYQKDRNSPYNQHRGLLSLGLFKDSLDILSSPAHTFSSVRPGDIKYKDVNGDGKIDKDDEVGLGKSDLPSLMYGFGFTFNYKSFFADMWFCGTGTSYVMLEGEGVFPFFGENEGNILESVLENRWVPEWYSGTKDTENPNAHFPRLTWGKSDNNSQYSDFWLQKVNFLKLKSVSIGYRWNLPFIRSKTFIDIILRGQNLLSFSQFKDWDPEQTTPNGAIYPIQRTYSFECCFLF